MRKFLNSIRKYFIPHANNEFKPHFLKRQSMIFISLLVIVLELAFLVQVFVVFDKTKFLAAVLPGVLTSITNEQRSQNNLPTLTLNSTLTKAANLKAQDMANKGYFAHTSPEGRTPWYWFDQVDYQYAYAGENLAVNFFESADVAEAWMNSPTHRDNIVKANYTEIGIGVAKGIYQGKETVFVAQLFGTPAKSFFSNVNEVFASPTVKTEQQKTTPQKVNPPTATTKPTVKTKPKATEPKVVTTPTTETKTQPIDTEVLSEISTSTVTSIIDTVHNQSSSVKSFIEKVLASPRHSLANVYELLALVVILSMVLVRLIKYEHQIHALSIMRGLVVVLIIGSLLLVNSKISTQTALKIPTGSLEASIIRSGY